MEQTHDVSKKGLDQAISACACFNFRKVTRLITQHFDEVLKPSGLLITQFTILIAIARLETVTVNDLAAILVMDRTTLTRNIKPLKRAGWLTIQPGQDKRTRVMTLTADGKRVLAEAMPLWQQAQRGFVEKLGSSRWGTLLPQLTEVTARLQD